MKWIIKNTGKYLWAVALLCVLVMLLTVAGVVQTLAMRNFIDQATMGNREGFLRWFAIFFGLIFFQLVGGAIRGLLTQMVSTSMYNKMVSKTFQNVLTRDYASIKHQHSAEYMQLITSDTSVVFGSVLGLPMSICALVTQIIAASACLTYLQGQLALILLGCFCVMIVVGLPFRKIIQKFHKRTMEAQAKVRSVLQESIDNLLVIRSFQAVKGVGDQAVDRMKNYRKVIMQKAVFSQALGSGCATAVNIAYIIGMLWCGMGIVNGVVTFGTFSAVWQLIGQITGPAMQVTGILPEYYTMIASAERLKELENRPAEKMDPKLDWKKARDQFIKISCEDITFSYDQKNPEETAILKGLDFTINRGDFVAITGESGIGKSTFLKLLLGVYYGREDGIMVHCKDGEQMPLDAGARTMISYVPQGNFLMSGTIRESIHFWQRDAIDEEKLLEACRIAEADGFIQGLEEGLETSLGERGAGLSEGQLQRLALARAIYSEKPVLLLDEATSALDEQTEAKVLNNLKELKNRTVIIVTHRKAALDICNRIVEMEDGKIVEVG